MIPRAVFEEVVTRGKEYGKVDALMVERLVEQLQLLMKILRRLEEL